MYPKTEHTPAHAARPRRFSLFATLLSLILVALMVVEMVIRPAPASAQSIIGYLGGCAVVARNPDGTYILADPTCVPSDNVFVGSLMLPTPTVSPTPTPPPIIVEGCTPIATRIIQDCELLLAGARYLQEPAVSELLAAHKLPPTDAARLLSWGRNTLRGVLFDKILGIIKKAPSQRTAIEQAIVDAFAAKVKKTRLDGALAARAAYNLWASNPCGYKAPAGFPAYNPGTACAGPIGGVTGGPNPPSLQEFQAYGAAAANSAFQNDPAIVQAAGQTAKNLGLIAGFAAVGGATIAAGAIGAAGAGLAIVYSLHPLLYGSVLVNGAVVSGSTVAAAAAPAFAAGLAGAVAIVVSAIVIAVMQGINVFTAAEIPGKLDAAITAAQTTPDLAQVVTTADGLREVFAAFIKTTMPEFAPTGSMPAPKAGDPQFLVKDDAGHVTLQPSLQYKDWSGTSHQVRMSDGWFVDTTGGNSKLTLGVEYIDWQGKGWSAWRVDDTFLHTRTGDQDTTNFKNDTIKFQTPDGKLWTAQYVEPNLPPSFTKGADVTVNEDSGAYSAAWATSISPGPANESAQTVSFLVSNSNSALFSQQPTVALDGKLSFTPAANANGSASVTVRAKDDGGTANGGVDTSALQTFTISVSAVNDAPYVLANAPTITVVEDTVQSFAIVADLGVNDTADTGGPVAAGAASFPPVTSLTTITAPAKGTLGYNTTAGTIMYTAAANADGADSFRYRVCDRGTPESACSEQTVNVSITAVNDPPSFTRGADQIVVLNAGAQSVSGWATAISAGPASESGQALSFTVSNDNSVLFSQQPTIDPNGTLTFTPAVGKVGSALVTVVLKDDGGTANGGSDTSTTQTFRIIVRYNFSGFAQPVDVAPTLNAATAGRTIPLKWQLIDANGNPVIDFTSATVTATGLACGTNTTFDQIEEYAAGGAGLQNLGDGYYQFNWAAPKSYAGSCKTLKLDLGEGTGQERTALFQFK